jgi:hypothetical protein
MPDRWEAGLMNTVELAAPTQHHIGPGLVVIIVIVIAVATVFLIRRGRGCRDR